MRTFTLAAAISLTLFTMLGAGVWIAQRAGKEARGKAVTSALTTIRRDTTCTQFRELVLGKTGRELTQLLGKPSSTTEGLTQGFYCWTYSNCCRDDASGLSNDAIIDLCGDSETFNVYRVRFQSH